MSSPRRAAGPVPMGPAVLLGLAVMALLGSTPRPARAEAPATPLAIEIRVPDPLPDRFEPFAVTAVVSARADAPGTVVRFEATPGVALERATGRGIAPRHVASRVSALREG